MNNFMQLAIEEAQKTTKDIPVGAVIVKDNIVIATAHNIKEITNNVSHHAEIVALEMASKKLENWRLDDCEMYVTLEPCPMCAWAIIQSRLKTVYFGSFDTQYGALGSKIDLRQISNSKLNVYGGILETKCDKILKDFFRDCRQKRL